MIDELLTILESFEYPVYRQGSMSDSDAYPATFITFWSSESPSHAFYDNKEYGAAYYYDVNVYSEDPDIVYSLLEEIREALINADWTIDGHGYDVPSDEETHTGRGFEAQYLLI